MCKACWEEAGSPRVDNEVVRLLAQLGKEIDPFGACHIVVDDWNVEDSHLDFCLLENPTPVEEGWLASMRMATVEERYSALALMDGLW